MQSGKNKSPTAPENTGDKKAYFVSFGERIGERKERIRSVRIGRRDSRSPQLPRHLVGRLKKETCPSVGERAESLAGATLVGIGAAGVRDTPLSAPLSRSLNPSPELKGIKLSSRMSLNKRYHSLDKE